MKTAIRKLNAVAASSWFIVLSGLASIISFLWFFYDKMVSNNAFMSFTVFSISLVVLFSGIVYSLIVRSENHALRSLSEIFYEINSIYRDTLRTVFISKAPVTNPEELLAIEEQVLKSVCQRIENIYSRSISRNCMATIKLVTEEKEGSCYAHTYVRSQEMCERDKPHRIKYIVGTGENTAFDKALASRSDGLPSHFRSLDLSKESDYSNQRQHFDRYYKSTIVVPIRGPINVKDANRDRLDLIGFLCIDTLSVNRLDKRYHLYMLSALANQMYNFMSLMRGKYLVFVE